MRPEIASTRRSEDLCKLWRVILYAFGSTTSSRNGRRVVTKAENSLPGMQVRGGVVRLMKSVPLGCTKTIREWSAKDENGRNYPLCYKFE